MRIVVVCGLPGSGKSFFASELAKRFDCELISSDVVRMQISNDKQYDKRSKNAVYQKMLSMMENCIKAHRNVILDATFFKADIRKLFIEKATALREPLYFIEVRASEDTIKKRVSHKRVNSDADYAVYQKIKYDFEPFTEEHLVLDTDTQSMDEMIAQALNYLNNSIHEAR